jgi:hypothetical protein
MPYTGRYFIILYYSTFVTLIARKFFCVEPEGLRGESCLGLFYCVYSQRTYMYSYHICGLQSCVWRLPKYQNIHPPPPLSTQRVCPPPAPKAPPPGDEGGGGSIFWKTPDIGLASYSIISLRLVCIRLEDLWQRLHAGILREIITRSLLSHNAPSLGINNAHYSTIQDLFFISLCISKDLLYNSVHSSKELSTAPNVLG